MATITLHRLKCEKQEDYTGSDSIRIYVDQPSRRMVWSGDIKSGQTASLNNPTADFKERISISLIEDDGVLGHSNIGNTAVETRQSPNRLTKLPPDALTFKKGRAHYKLWYSLTVGGPVIPKPTGPISEPLDKPKTPPTKKRPPKYPSGTGGAGKGKVACKLGSLVVKVIDDRNRPIEKAAVHVHRAVAVKWTPKNGQCTFPGLPAGSYVVEVSKAGYLPAPHTTVARVKAGPPTRVTARLGKFKVVKITPDKDARWYVNMDPDEASHHGRQITVRAYLEPKAPGVSVIFKLSNLEEGTAAKRRNTTHTALTAKTALTDTNGVATTKIKLSTHGGDWCAVSAALDRNMQNAKHTGKFHVWRKLYYEITEMRKRPNTHDCYRLPQTALNIMKQGYKDVFIEMAPLSDVPRLAKFARKEGAHGRSVYVKTKRKNPWPELRKWADRFRSPHQVPWKVHIVVTSRLAERREKTIERDVPQTDTIIRNYVFDPWGPNKSDWLVRAEYRIAGLGGWKPLPSSAVDVVPAGKRRRLKIMMNKAVPGANRLYRVRVHHRTAYLGTIGYQLGHNLFVFMENNQHWRSGNALTQTLGRVCIHEIGHALDLLSGSMSWKHAKKKAHCADRRCVMWWTVSPSSPTKFRGANNKNNCRSYLLGKELSRGVLKSHKNWA